MQSCGIFLLHFFMVIYMVNFGQTGIYHNGENHYAAVGKSG
ncbi:Hypothetical protein NGK_0634 [Neisseria gonorrhoeae NCCP11945]|uniref:Uncharacterized protein n=1 Tax=Neisseria gonorrhoeae (strain NCCP11945) TaxID=521006 RepID=B4RKH4_NEIG2|nr:Hypothetical protein NGK_0634 [Neisseria gonorrhoeae NCCP11945]